MRTALRRRDLFAAPSLRYADPRRGLLEGAAWEAARPAICRTLGLSTDAGAEVARLGERLDAAYRTTAANLPANAAVQVEDDDLVLAALDKLDEPASLVALRTAVQARMPRLDLPGLASVEVTSEDPGSSIEASRLRLMITPSCCWRGTPAPASPAASRPPAKAARGPATSPPASAPCCWPRPATPASSR